MLAGLRSSLFARITLIVVAAATVMMLIVAGFGEAFFHHGKDAQWGRHAAEYVRVIATQAIAAKSPAELDALAARLGLDIRYRGPHLIHSTAPLPEFGETRPARRWLRHKEVHLRRRCPHGDKECRRRFWSAPRHRRIAFVSAAGRNFLHYRRGEHRLLIAMRDDDGGAFAAAPWLWGGLALALAALFGGVYWLIRRSLSPLTGLEKNLKAVGRGEWREMQTARGDEIGRVIRGFNDMQRRIRQMLAAKERLLIDASHEFRTPLARIKVALELIGDEQAKARIGDDIRELESLTDELLQTQRAAGARPQTKVCAAADIIQAALAQIPPDARRFVAVNIPPPTGESVKVDVDLRQATRAVKNLIENALKYGRPREGGEIKIALARGAMADGGAAAVITIADCGEGIPADELAFIFEPFYRVEKSRVRKSPGGYGLGLPLAKAVIEAHGGTLGVSSAPGKGTTATVQLPLAA